MLSDCLRITLENTLHPFVVSQLHHVGHTFWIFRIVVTPSIQYYTVAGIYSIIPSRPNHLRAITHYIGQTGCIGETPSVVDL